jgi:hypothetical protein
VKILTLSTLFVFYVKGTVAQGFFVISGKKYSERNTGHELRNENDYYLPPLNLNFSREYHFTHSLQLGMQQEI